MEWRRVVAGVVLLVASFFAGFVSSSPDEDADTENSYSANTPSIGSAADGEDYVADAPQKTNHHASHWYTALKQPVWLQLIIAAIGIGVITWQSYETRRAAQATQISARASEVSATALVSSERAWVLVDTGEVNDAFEPDPNMVEFFDLRPVVRNYGRTPARIIRTSIRSQQIPSGSELPSEPDYGPARNVDIMVPPEVVIQPLRTLIELSDFIEIRRGERVLYVYGFVDYESFGSEKRSRFCIMYTVPGGFNASRRGFYLAVNVPRAYTQCD